MIFLSPRGSDLCFLPWDFSRVEVWDWEMPGSFLPWELFWTPEKYMATLCAAVFLAAVWAGVLLVAFKKNGKTEIPFVPFLLLGYIGGLIL